jgi:hypothetical protein
VAQENDMLELLGSFDTVEPAFLDTHLLVKAFILLRIASALHGRLKTNL